MKKLIFILISLILPICAFSQSRPIIENLEANSTELYKIKLTWTLPSMPSPKIEKLFIYRDSKQITSYSQISNLNPIATLDKNSTFYIDNVQNTNEYFYSIIAETNDGPYKIIIPSINSTLNGIMPLFKNTSNNSNRNIQHKETFTINQNSKRVFPLPQINFDKNNDSKNNKITLGKKAIDAGNELGKGYNKKNYISKIHVFEEDLICPEGGDEYFLFRILKESFVKNNFATSVENLTDFLSVYRNKETTSRAIFYLAESYYFSGNYEKAIYHFLAVKDIYPELTKKWLDSSLDLYKLN